MKLHFLIVDDSDLSLKVITSLLKNISISCDCVSSASRAYELLEKSKYDMILLDYMMPDVNGIEAAEYIRNLCSPDFDSTYFSEIPIIMFTADDTFDNTLEKQDKISGYIPKPVNNAELLGLIKNYFPDYDFINQNDKNADKSPQIEGIDADPAECLPYLEIFSETCDTIAQNIKVALQMNDVNMYTIEVHRIKGEAKIISATSLSNLALELECAGKTITGDFNNGFTEQENMSIITDKTPLLLEALLKLKKDIRLYKDNNGLTSEVRTVKEDSAEKDSSEYNMSKKKRDKIIRYLNYAIESIDAGDDINAKDWINGVIDLLL